MAIIVIKDLLDSVDLDRQAMAAITGGAHALGRQSLHARTTLRSLSISNAIGVGYNPLTGTSPRPAESTRRK